MKKITMILITFIMVFALAACGSTGGAPVQSSEPETPAVSPSVTMEPETPDVSPSVTSEQEMPPEEESNAAEGEVVNGFKLSDMVVRITSAGYTATFQLYDTVAAAELYKQLPLELELSNFSNAQWMFYPPERLSVTDAEAYHDGKKGELSYYEPWGDAFMLYEDFYAGDHMHRLGIGLSGIDDIASMSGTAVIEIEETANGEIPQEDVSGEATAMRIQVEANGNAIVFELNDSKAAQELYDQLPLSLSVENYASNEKIFYPPEELDTSDAPSANSVVGTLAYYAPWGDVVMFYGDFGSAGGLYELGQAVSGSERIQDLSGTIEITKAE